MPITKTIADVEAYFARKREADAERDRGRRDALASAVAAQAEAALDEMASTARDAYSASQNAAFVGRKPHVHADTPEEAREIMQRQNRETFVQREGVMRVDVVPESPEHARQLMRAANEAAFVPCSHTPTSKLDATARRVELIKRLAALFPPDAKRRGKRGRK